MGRGKTDSQTAEWVSRGRFSYKKRGKRHPERFLEHQKLFAHSTQVACGENLSPRGCSAPTHLVTPEHIGTNPGEGQIIVSLHDSAFGPNEERHKLLACTVSRSLRLNRLLPTSVGFWSQTKGISFFPSPLSVSHAMMHEDLSFSWFLPWIPDLFGYEAFPGKIPQTFTIPIVISRVVSEPMFCRIVPYTLPQPGKRTLHISPTADISYNKESTSIERETCALLVSNALDLVGGDLLFPPIGAGSIQAPELSGLCLLYSTLKSL